MLKRNALHATLDITMKLYLAILSESVLLQRAAIVLPTPLIQVLILQIQSVPHARVDIGTKKMMEETMDLVKKALIVEYPLWHSQWVHLRQLIPLVIVAQLVCQDSLK